MPTLIILFVLLISAWAIAAGYIYYTWDGSQYDPDYEIEVEQVDSASKVFYSFCFVPFFTIAFLTVLPILLWNRMRG